MPKFPKFITELQSQRNQLQAELQRLDEAIRAVERLNGRGTRNGTSRAAGSSRHISAAGRARIAAAQRARWAKAKEAPQVGGFGRSVERLARGWLRHSVRGGRRSRRLLNRLRASRKGLSRGGVWHQTYQNLPCESPTKANHLKTLSDYMPICSTRFLLV